MTMQQDLPGPLAGLRVIELTNYVGQWCGKLMADLGADVIKVEPPGGADERNIGPFYKDQPNPERSLYFWHYNTSKRGVTLDLEQEEGRQFFRKLVATADVLLDSMKPGYLDSIGLGYDVLSKDRSDLIMCSLTPFGQNGPWRDYPSTDLVHLAAGGQMAMCGYFESDDPGQMPIAPGGGNAWHMGSHYAFIATLAAVHLEHLTGQGQFIDVSVHEACALTTEMHMSTYIYTGKIAHRQTGQHASALPRPPAQIKTGTPGTLMQASVNVANIRQLGSIIQWMDSKGMAGDLTDPKYQDPKYVAENGPEISQKVTDFIASIPAEEAFHGAQQSGMPWGIVRAPEEVAEDDHFHARGFFPDVEYPELGETYKHLGGAAIMPKSPWRIYHRAPLIGEHNKEVFAEVGVSGADLRRLQGAGVI